MSRASLTLPILLVRKQFSLTCYSSFTGQISLLFRFYECQSSPSDQRKVCAHASPLLPPLTPFLISFVCSFLFHFSLPPSLPPSISLSSSYIKLSEYIFGIDNRLRPYSYQTHADILRVSPATGSVEGGTTITVETSVNLDSYNTDDVKVYVGGEREWGERREE